MRDCFEALAQMLSGPACSLWQGLSTPSGTLGARLAEGRPERAVDTSLSCRLTPLAGELRYLLLNIYEPNAPAGKNGEIDKVRCFLPPVLLICFLIPLIFFRFSYAGYMGAALFVLLVGSWMLASLWVMSAVGQLWLGRDIFLGSLLMLLLWEAYFFQTIYSPGAVWVVTVPVAGLLIGGTRAGIIWSGLVLGALFSAFMWIEAPKTHTYFSDHSTFLYVVSLSCVAVWMFLCLHSVEGGRTNGDSRLARANAEIKHRAERDALTGLVNRTVFYEVLANRLGAMTAKEQITILIIDIDDFRAINDTYGREFGDKLLRRLAEGLSASYTIDGAVVARLGGDEFAFLISHVEARAAAAGLAQAALAWVQEGLEVDGRRADVGMSIGIAVANSRDPSELMRRAEVALHEAKRRGKNQFCWHKEAFDRGRKKRLEMAAELRRAIENGGIHVQYQPIVDARTRQIAAAEALARWTRADGSRVPPDEFVSLAEEAGLIDKLGILVLRTACEDLARWPELKLAVNLSPVQFRCPTLIEDIQRVLKEAAIPPARLELEVTENYLIEHKETVQPRLDEIRRLGISIALDDFGTGYSSIGYLREYKFDRLKIDKTLVDGVAEDPAARSIIQAACILAKTLGMNLTAEGVENEEAAQLLRAAGCDNLQGYHFGRPQSADQLKTLLAAQA